MTPHASAPPAPAVESLKSMIRIRRFEERCAQLREEGRLPDPVHLCIGQEAVAAGLAAALGPSDTVFANHRAHGHALARGADPAWLLRRLHDAPGAALVSEERGLFAGLGLDAAHLSLAVGWALEDRLADRGRVTACVFGDGATLDGAFHEALHHAATWSAPVLFVCENNHGDESFAGDPVPDHRPPLFATAAGMCGESVDGMDVNAVARAARRAVASIRAGAGPWLLELRTFRFGAHAEGRRDDRTAGDIETWRRHDPLARQASWLQARNLTGREAVLRLHHEVDEEIDAAVTAAGLERPRLQEIR